MSDNWVVQNLENALETWNEKLSEIWTLITTTPQNFIIFSVFASSPPVVNPDAAAVTQVWAYIGELVFNMLVLVGAVKMSDRIIREMMGL